jgi:hypothetical protein
VLNLSLTYVLSFSTYRCAEPAPDGATAATVATVKMILSEQPSLSLRPSRIGKDRKMKSVQIPYDLFIDLAMYHLRGEDDFEEEIRQGLEQKLDAMLNRQLYSRYKTAPNEEEREQARQEYLDRRGVPQSYRWTTPPWEL